MKALTDEESDAAQMTFPAYVHGMLKMEAFAGTIRPDQEAAKVVLRVPAERGFLVPLLVGPSARIRAAAGRAGLRKR